MKLLPALLMTGAAIAACGPANAQTFASDELDQLRGAGVVERVDAELPLDLAFTDHTGKEVVIGDLIGQGKPVVLTLNYANCPMLCNLQLDGLSNALAEATWRVGDQFQVVTVSIDPRDTPKHAADFRKSLLAGYGRKVDDHAWPVLVSDDEARIRQFADAVGFGYQYIADKDQYAHAAVAMLLTPEGRVTRYLYGLQIPARTLEMSLLECARGEVTSSFDKVLLYCFVYDANTGRYAPAAMNLVRVFGALLTLGLIGFFYRLFRGERTPNQSHTA